MNIQNYSILDFFWSIFEEEKIIKIVVRLAYWQFITNKNSFKKIIFFFKVVRWPFELFS